MRYLTRFALACTLLLALLGLVQSPHVAAVDITSDVCNTSHNKPVFCNDTRDAQGSNPILGKDGIVTKGIRIFLVIVGIISVFVILVNATKMITSNGDPNSVSKARNGIIYAAIGLVVAMSAQLIIITVVNKLN